MTWAVLMRFGTVLCWLLALATLGVSHARAEEGKTEAPSDCRYEPREGGTNSSAFPTDDVFRPLIADPKQPQFFASWQSARARMEQTHANIGSVGIGENFGFYTSREGCNGWQAGVLAGVFS